MFHKSYGQNLGSCTVQAKTYSLLQVSPSQVAIFALNTKASSYLRTC